MYLTKAIEHITGTANPSTEDLLGLTKQYPYFAIPYAILLAQQKNNASGNSFYQKLQLFTPHNNWLQFVINNANITEPTLLSIEDIQFEKNKLIEPINHYDDDSTQFSNNTSVADEQPVSTILQTEKQVENIHEELKEETPIFEPVHFSSPSETNIIAPRLEPSIPQNTPTNNNNGSIQTNTSSIEVPSLETVRMLLQGKTPGSNEAVTVVEEKIATIAEPVTSILEEPIAAKPATNIPSYQFNGFSNGTPYTNGNAVELSEEYAKAAAEEELENQEEPLENTKLSSVLSNQITNFKKPVEADAKLDFETEPFYTVDYFASQGIKIDLTKQPQDKLTVQLRRFTDWLKQMKNTNPNPTDLGTDPELEKAIQNIAQTSIEAREIVTETMADVFIKQGKVDKAIQLYIKLSFLDPHKSTYFAKKIEQLKGI